MTKSFWKSKELWVVALGALNYVLNYFSLPSLEPTPELYGALLVLVGALRLWFTKAKLTLN